MSTAPANYSHLPGSNNALLASDQGFQASPGRKRPGALVISLDFELHWGVRDSAPLDRNERARLLSARRIVPRMLDLFEEFSIHATWATVGLLFAQSRTEAEAFMPSRRPKYRDSRLDPYQETLGSGEADDPFHFAPSLIAEVASRPGQEIACHSFSHYYAMEPGQAGEEFEADLLSAVAIAAQSGHSLRSYVFPRNEVNPEYLSILKRSGILAYRGTEPAKIKHARSFDEQRRPHRRLGRLLDSYLDLCGNQTCRWPHDGRLISVAASRYLRPYSPVLQPFENSRHARIAQAMKYAAEHGEIFHLWWHPEDFSYDCNENLRFLRSVLKTFDSYRAQHGMVSVGMAEIISLIESAQPMCTSVTGAI
ncbi:MAG: polysaccharide deacetylase family protein [Acidobacteria bacterium]|nr:polysaccharide deacetylase family protein [Acidobacteriota bacterium]